MPSALPPKGAEPTTHYFSVTSGFNASNEACDVVHNHIPLDPGNVLGLVLRKEGDLWVIVAEHYSYKRST